MLFAINTSLKRLIIIIYTNMNIKFTILSWINQASQSLLVIAIIFVN